MTSARFGARPAEASPAVLAPLIIRSKISPLSLFGDDHDAFQMPFFRTDVRSSHNRREDEGLARTGGQVPTPEIGMGRNVVDDCCHPDRVGLADLLYEDILRQPRPAGLLLRGNGEER